MFKLPYIWYTDIQTHTRTMLNLDIYEIDFPLCSLLMRMRFYVQ